MTDVLTKCGDLGASRGRGLAKRGVAAVVALAVLGTSSLAWSQAKPAAPGKAAATAAKAPAKKGDKKAAGAAFKKGKEALEKKDFKTAKESFMEAEEILPAAAAEYYIAISAEELGEHQEAAKWYSKALEGKLKDDQAADAKARLEALQKKPAKVTITSEPAGATILVDGTAIPEKTPAEIQLAPGSHKITLKAEGRKDLEQTVEVAAFTGAAVSGALEAAPPAVPAEPVAEAPATPPVAAPVAPAPAAPAETGKRDMTWVYVTGGAAIVALGVGTVFGLQALSKKSEFDDAVTAGDAQAARDARDDGTRNALISDMGFGIGITLAVTSAVLFFTRPAAEGDTKAAAKSSPKTFSFAPVVTGTGAGAAALIQF